MAILQLPRFRREARWGTTNVRPNSLGAFPGARTTMTPNLPGTCPRARWSVTYGDHVAPQLFQLQTESRQQILFYFTFGGTPY